MDGIEATQHLKKEGAAARIVVVSSESRYQERALAVGADAYLTKPFTADTVSFFRPANYRNRRARADAGRAYSGCD